jgi:hypothetical protein
LAVAVWSALSVQRKRCWRTAVTSESAFLSFISLNPVVKSFGVISGDVAWMRQQ